jgi:hypothetical protein
MKLFTIDDNGITCMSDTGLKEARHRITATQQSHRGKDEEDGGKIFRSAHHSPKSNEKL